MKGKVYCVLSVVPGNGAKYVATNLAVSHKRKSKDSKILIIDLDFINPVLCRHFIKGVNPLGIDHLAPRVDTMDELFFKNSLSTTGLGVDILSGTTLFDKQEQFSKNFVFKVIGIAKQLYDAIYIVVNPTITSSATVVSLLNADKTVLVARNNYTNELKIGEVIKMVKTFYKKNENVLLVYNYHTLKHSLSVTQRIHEPNIKIVGLLEYDPKTVDNINLTTKIRIMGKCQNDSKFNVILKELIK